MKATISKKDFLIMDISQLTDSQLLKMYLCDDCHDELPNKCSACIHAANEIVNRCHKEIETCAEILFQDLWGKHVLVTLADCYSIIRVQLLKDIKLYPKFDLNLDEINLLDEPLKALEQYRYVIKLQEPIE